MFELLRARLQQGRQTLRFPNANVTLPERFRGRPEIDSSRCVDGCTLCVEACPTSAISITHLGGKSEVRLDLGACTFCPVCESACPGGAIRFTPEFRLATRERTSLVVTEAEYVLARELDEKAKKLFGHSLKLRQVSAGGCNGCESELAATGNIVFDLGRFGIQFVASPRHADAVVVTGPVTANMRQALWETWQAVPDPRLVIAVGACAISGGPFAGSIAANDGIPTEIPVDLYIPGCPPHPLTIVDGILRLLGRLGG
jgi:Ni,Fe-hydrogenase III small subunit/ferredoxin